MANFSSIGALRREMIAYERDLTTAEFRRISREQAERGQELADRAAARDLGSDRSFTGWLPGALDTTIVQRGQDAILTPDSRLAAAKWTTADLGRQSGKHGRTRALHTASEAVTAMQRDPEMQAIAERGVERQLRRHFGGV